MLRRMQNATLEYWRGFHRKAIAKASKEQLLRQSYAVAEMASWPWLDPIQAESEATRAVCLAATPKETWFVEDDKKSMNEIGKEKPAATSHWLESEDD